MSLLGYEKLTENSSRADVRATLKKISEVPPNPIDVEARKGLVQRLVDDVHNSVVYKEGSILSAEDAQPALFALKTLGRLNECSRIIAKEDNLSRLFAIEKTLRTADEDAANECLRCIANALLLIDSGRDAWVRVGGAAYTLNILRKPTSVLVVFLASRILFLSTVSSTSPFLHDILKQLATEDPTTTRNKNWNVIDVIESKLDFVLRSHLRYTSSSKEAMVDLLKFTFNVLCHGPKLLGIQSAAGNDNDERESILGDRWNDHLNGLLAPLLRVYIKVPRQSNPPLQAPLTHILHSLIAIPITKELRPIWLGEEDSSYDPESDSGKGKRVDGDKRAPEIFILTLDSLETALKYYLPGKVDPDDESVRKRIVQQDEELDHLLSPLFILLTKLCQASPECRKAFRQKVIPSDLDRTSPLEERSDTLGRCIRLMACIRHNQLKDAAGELLYVAADSDAKTLCGLIGYGNAAGFLFNRGVLNPPLGVQTNDDTPASSAATAEAEGAPVNPITGMAENEPPPPIDMTDEEKEREAEKLFVLFDRLEKTTGMENPIKKALHEGKLEKYRG